MRAMNMPAPADACTNILEVVSDWSHNAKIRRLSKGLGLSASAARSLPPRQGSINGGK